MVGKTRLGRHYAALVVRDRKSDPVRGLLFAVSEEERKGYSIKADQGSDVCSCRGETDLFSVLTGKN